MPFRFGGENRSRIAPILYVLVAVATVWFVSRGTIAAVSLLERVDHEADVLYIGFRVFQMILFGMFLIAEDTQDRTDRRIEYDRNKRFLAGFVIAFGLVLVLTLQGMRDITIWRWVSVTLGFAAAVMYPRLLARAAGHWLPRNDRRSLWLALVYAVVLCFEVGFSGWAAYHMDTSLLLRIVTDPTVLIRGIGTVFLPARWTALSWIAGHPGNLPFWFNIVSMFTCAWAVARFGSERSAEVVIQKPPRHRLSFRQIAFPWLFPAALGCVLFWVPAALRLARFVFPYSSQIAQWGVFIAGIVGLWLGWWIQGVTTQNAKGRERENAAVERTRERRISFFSAGLFSVFIGIVTRVPWIWIAAAVISMGIVAWPTGDAHERSRVFTGPSLLFTGTVTWMVMRFVGKIPMSSRILAVSVVLGWAVLTGLRYCCYYNLKKQRKNAS